MGGAVLALVAVPPLSIGSARELAVVGTAAAAGRTTAGRWGQEHSAAGQGGCRAHRRAVSLAPWTRGIRRRPVRRRDWHLRAAAARSGPGPHDRGTQPCSP